MKTRLSAMLCGILLYCAMLVGCVSTANVDGTSTTTPDYAMIEFGAIAAFTVLVNETDVPQDRVEKAYLGLSNIEMILARLAGTGESLDLAVLDSMLSEALPVEYQALAKSGSKLIRSRVQMYVDLPEIELDERATIVNTIALTVVSGAKQALEPKLIR